MHCPTIHSTDSSGGVPVPGCVCFWPRPFLFCFFFFFFFLLLLPHPFLLQQEGVHCLKILAWLLEQRKPACSGHMLLFCFCCRTYCRVVGCHKCCGQRRWQWESCASATRCACDPCIRWNFCSCFLGWKRLLDFSAPFLFHSSCVVFALLCSLECVCQHVTSSTKWQGLFFHAAACDIIPVPF